MVIMIIFVITAVIMITIIIFHVKKRSKVVEKWKCST